MYKVLPYEHGHGVRRGAVPFLVSKEWREKWSASHDGVSPPKVFCIENEHGTSSEILDLEIIKQELGEYIPSNMPTLRSPDVTPQQVVDAWCKKLAEIMVGEEEENQKISERREEEKKQMREWILKHGSDHLKRAFMQGFKVRGLYLDERVKADLPEGFQIITRPHKKEVINPTPYELDELEKAQTALEGTPYEVSISWAGNHAQLLVEDFHLESAAKELLYREEQKEMEESERS